MLHEVQQVGHYQILEELGRGGMGALPRRGSLGPLPRGRAPAAAGRARDWKRGANAIETLPLPTALGDPLALLAGPGESVYLATSRGLVVRLRLAEGKCNKDLALLPSGSRGLTSKAYGGERGGRRRRWSW